MKSASGQSKRGRRRKKHKWQLRRPSLQHLARRELLAFDLPNALVGEIHHEAVVSTSFGFGEGRFAKLQERDFDFEQGQIHHQSQSIALAQQLGVDQILLPSSNQPSDEIRFGGTGGQFMMNANGEVHRLDELGQVVGEQVGTASPYFFQNPELFSTIPAEVQDRYKMQSHDELRRNFGNRGEVWFRSPRAENGFLYLLPDGSLHEWTEDSSDLTPSADNLAGQVGPFFHQHPDVLVRWNTTGHGLIQLELKPVGPSIEGIDAGFVGGDLQFLENQWRGSTNKNEYTVEGSFLQASSGQTFSLGHLGFGIAVQDSETGSGYLMYSSENVHERFAASPPLPGTSNHIIAVRLEQGAWQYNTNREWIPFSPISEDRLLAAVDYQSGEVQSYQGFDDSFSGIPRGYQDGDLRFEGNTWKFAVNPGEYQLYGTTFRTSNQPPTQLGETGGGITVSDDAGGRGYLMHSGIELTHRFRETNFQQHHSSQLIAVRRRDGVWQYNDNQAWVPFEPIDGDRLLAEVNFSDDQVQSFQNLSGRRNGIELGFVGGDLSFHANRFRGRDNLGEFTVEGTHYHVGKAIGPSGNGIAVSDNATGIAFLMHSELPLHDRFANSPWRNGHAEHLVAVRYRDGSWFYNDNRSWHLFSPAGSDHLLARIDLDATSITALLGDHAPVQGISAGFENGDLRFEANRWNDQGDLGEYQISGTYYVPNPITMTSLGQINGGLAVADGATGSGYVLHSNRPLDQRDGITVHPQNSRRLLIVRQTDDQWEYNGNSEWKPFTPEDGDRLIAAVDFENDSISDLVGRSTLIGGIEAGYIDGDLDFAANRFNGSDNSGEFTVTGSYFRSQPVRATLLGNVNSGIAVSDSAVGRGYVMHSATPIRDRFSENSFRDDVSDDLLVIRRFGGRWQFNDNRDWTTFVPEQDDVILAEIDFDAGEFSSFQNRLGTIGGIGRGYVDGDLRFLANQFNQRSNAGEYTVEGTFFQSGSALGAVNYGIAVNDQAIGKGYVLLSERPLNGRLSPKSLAGNNSSRMAAVQYRDGSWFMNDNAQWIAFEPLASDRLIAAIDFDTNVITPFLSYKNISGIDGDTHYLTVADVVPGFEDSFDIELLVDNTSERVLLMTAVLGDADTVAEYSEFGELTRKSIISPTRRFVQTRSDDLVSDAYLVDGKVAWELERRGEETVIHYRVDEQNVTHITQYQVGADGATELLIPSLKSVEGSPSKIEGEVELRQQLEPGGILTTTVESEGSIIREYSAPDRHFVEATTPEGFEMVDGVETPVVAIQVTEDVNDDTVNYTQTNYRQVGTASREQTQQQVFLKDGTSTRVFIDPSDDSKQITHFTDEDDRVFREEILSLGSFLGETQRTTFEYDDNDDVVRTVVESLTTRPDPIVRVRRELTSLENGASVEVMYVRGDDLSRIEQTRVDGDLATERRWGSDGGFQFSFFEAANRLQAGLMAEEHSQVDYIYESPGDTQAKAIFITQTDGVRFETYAEPNGRVTIQRIGANGKLELVERYDGQTLIRQTEYQSDGTTIDRSFQPDGKLLYNEIKPSGQAISAQYDNNQLATLKVTDVDSNGMVVEETISYPEPGNTSKSIQQFFQGGKLVQQVVQSRWTKFYTQTQPDGTVIRYTDIINEQTQERGLFEVLRPDGTGYRKVVKVTNVAFSLVPLYDRYEETFVDGEVTRRVGEIYLRDANGGITTQKIQQDSDQPGLSLSVIGDAWKRNVEEPAKRLYDDNIRDPLNGAQQQYEAFKQGLPDIPSIGDLIGSGIDFAEHIAEQAKSGFASITDDFKDVFAEFNIPTLQDFADGLDRIYDDVLDFGSVVLDDISGAINGVIEPIIEPFEDLLANGFDTPVFDLPQVPAIADLSFDGLEDLGGITTVLNVDWSQSFTGFKNPFVFIGETFDKFGGWIEDGERNPFIILRDFLMDDFIRKRILVPQEVDRRTRLDHLPLGSGSEAPEDHVENFRIELDFLGQESAFLADPQDPGRNPAAVAAVEAAAETLSVLINTRLASVLYPNVTVAINNPYSEETEVRNELLKPGVFKIYVGQKYFTQRKNGGADNETEPDMITLGRGGPLYFRSESSAFALLEHAYDRVGGTYLATPAGQRPPLSFGAFNVNLNQENWHTDVLSDPSSTGGDDLYSLALHEMMHAIGYTRGTKWQAAIDQGGVLYSTPGGDTTLVRIEEGGGEAHLELGATSPNYSTGLSTSFVGAPKLFTGTRTQFTELDALILGITGYDVYHRDELNQLGNADRQFLTGTLGWTIPGNIVQSSVLSTNSLDVNLDGSVTASDALFIINRLDQASLAESESIVPIRFELETADVNGDGAVTAWDALLVINDLNRDRSESLVADKADSDVTAAELGKPVDGSEIGLLRDFRVTPVDETTLALLAGFDTEGEFDPGSIADKAFQDIGRLF